jgi:NAD(P)-dependent dehydrogenase (short-subunit alcohol dehydrogenase family)
MTVLKPIAEQTMVITGASSGIGRLTALTAAGRGARVVLAARDAEALTALEERIRRSGGRALAVPSDVSDEEQVQALADRAADTFQGIDTWVNNAAVSVYGTFLQVPTSDARRVLEVNFLGQLYGARAALPYLERQGQGALICVGSALSDRAVQLQSAYCASKHALKALTESLRIELREAGSPVQVTLIKPSSMNTPLFEYAATYMGVKPRPMPPVYDPSLVTKAILSAAEHPTREITVGGGAKLLTTLETCAGPLLDWWLARSGSRSQRTTEPKRREAPNNLYAPADMPRHVHGSGSGRRFSAYTWTRLHPRIALAGGATAALAGGIALRRTRASRP